MSEGGKRRRIFGRITSPGYVLEKKCLTKEDFQEPLAGCMQPFRQKYQRHCGVGKNRSGLAGDVFVV